MYSFFQQMEWMYFNPETATFGPLAYQVGDKFELVPNALMTLEAMDRKLAEEDKTLRTFRRFLGFSQTLQKDVLPILNLCKDKPTIFFAAVRYVCATARTHSV